MKALLVLIASYWFTSTELAEMPTQAAPNTEINSPSEIVASSMASATSGFVQVELTNNTGLDDTAVYVLVKGSVTVKNELPACAAEKEILPLKQGYLNIDKATGKGSYALVDSSSNSVQYSVKFADLPAANGKRQLQIPQPFISGRIYFSINEPLFLQIAPDASAIVDPSCFALNDPNYYTLYDKIEFTYTCPATGANLYANPTAVDYFSLPLYLQMQNPVGEAPSSSGFNASRSTIFTSVQNSFKNEDKTAKQIWSNLLLTDEHAPSKPILRIASPTTATTIHPGVTSANPAHAFPTDYLINYGFNYIDNIWDFYSKSGNQLNIDVSEITDHWGNPAIPGEYIFTGSVQNGVFTFTNGPKDFTWTIRTKPDSAFPFFAGAQFNDDGEANNTPGAIIIRELTAAFEVGFLPVSFPEGSFLNKAYLIGLKEHYYKPNAEWGSAGADNGPYYDLYSSALHRLNAPIYTFAYDDALGQDGTLAGNVEASNASLSITLGALDLTQDQIPNPFNDTSSYSVIVQAAANNPVQYRTSTTGQFQDLPEGGTLSNIVSNKTTPFQIQLMDKNSKLQVINIYLKYNLAIPEVPDFSLSGGIVFEQTDSTITLQTPGLPKAIANTLDLPQQ